MKKILIAAMALACTAAFAGESQHGGSQGASAQQQQKQQQEANSTSLSAAQNAGNNQTITVAPVTTNVASDLKDQGATAAAINSAAALEIAKIQAGQNGDRDLSADQRAALDRQAAKDIAKTQQTIKNTPSIALGQLTSSNDTCMGSVSVGGSGPGFSVGIGSTYKDDNCVMLKNSRELWNMGMKAAAMALMCTDKANKEALELTGFVCPQTEAANKAAVKKAEAEAAAKVAQTGGAERLATAYTGNDPIVQARMAASK